MSFDPSINYYKKMVLSGRLPYPYHYPYLTTAPNLSSQTNNVYISALDNCYYGYEGCKMYNRENNTCHNPSHSTSNNISHNYDPRLEIYNYVAYDKCQSMIQSMVQDPSFAMGFFVVFLVSNIPLAPPLIPQPPLIPISVTPVFAAPRIPASTPLKLPTVNPIVGPIIEPIAIAPCPKNFDPNLIDPWGLLIANDIIWVANVGSGFITRYDLIGRPIAPPINVFGPMANIAQPTSIVYNPNQCGFMIYRERFGAGSTMIIATRDGTINGYNEAVDPFNSIMVVNNTNSVYTGMTLANNTLYVTDFYNKKIDVFDSNFIPITTIPIIDGCESDPMPPEYSPINIAFLCDFLYVAYAKQSNRDGQYEVPGCGHGYINIYRLDGLFIKRFHSRNVLNIPWSMILAPSYFGYPAGSIMVSNFGDGVINIFSSDGSYLSTLADPSGNNIYLEGLHGLVVNPVYDRVIHWTAKPINVCDSCVGSIASRVVV